MIGFQLRKGFDGEVDPSYLSAEVITKEKAGSKDRRAHACEWKMDPTRCWCSFSQDVLPCPPQPRQRLAVSGVALAKTGATSIGLYERKLFNENKSQQNLGDFFRRQELSDGL